MNLEGSSCALYTFSAINIEKKVKTEAKQKQWVWILNSRESQTGSSVTLN